MTSVSNGPVSIILLANKPTAALTSTSHICAAVPTKCFSLKINSSKSKLSSPGLNPTSTAVPPERKIFKEVFVEPATPEHSSTESKSLYIDISFSTKGFKTSKPNFRATSCRTGFGS